MLKSMKKRFLKPSSGMTLLEVLVSMLLIGSALGMSLSMIQSSLQFERNALRTSAFLDAVEEFAALARSNQLCEASYAFNGFTLNAQNRATPTFTNTSCASTYKNTNLVTASHNRAQADVSNWLSNLIQHFPQGATERRNTKVIYDPRDRILRIEIPYLQNEATENLQEGLGTEEFSFKYSVQL